MPVTAQRSRARRLAVACLAGALIMGAPAAATAYWSASTSLPKVAATTPTNAKPVTKCTSMTGLAGIGSAARVSWTAIPGATGFTLTATSVTNPAASISATAAAGATYYDVAGGLLSGLAGNVTVTVVANFGATWASLPSTPVLVGPDGVLGYVLGGSKCLP